MRAVPGLAHPAPGPNQLGRQPAHLANLCGFRDCSCGDSLGHPGAIVIENRRLYAAAQPDGSVVLQELPQTIEAAEDLEPLRPQTQGSIRTHPEPLTA